MTVLVVAACAFSLPTVRPVTPVSAKIRLLLAISAGARRLARNNPKGIPPRNTCHGQQMTPGQAIREFMPGHAVIENLSDRVASDIYLSLWLCIKRVLPGLV